MFTGITRVEESCDIRTDSGSSSDSNSKCYYNFRMPLVRHFIFGTQVYPYDIQVIFGYQGHGVKIKVKVKTLVSFMILTFKFLMLGISFLYADILYTELGSRKVLALTHSRSNYI